MFNAKTYFEQVPLKFVKQIVEEQIDTEAASETMQEFDEEPLVEGLSEVEGGSSLEPGTADQAGSVN